MLTLRVGEELTPLAVLGLFVELTAAQYQVSVKCLAVPIIAVGTIPTPVLWLFGLFL